MPSKTPSLRTSNHVSGIVSSVADFYLPHEVGGSRSLHSAIASLSKSSLVEAAIGADLLKFGPAAFLDLL